MAILFMWPYFDFGYPVYVTLADFGYPVYVTLVDFGYPVYALTIACP